MTDNVQEQHENNGKLPGGITGRGFKPGRSGNPGGRPKGKTLTWHLRRLLDTDSNIEDLAKAIIAKAKTGDAKMVGLILERIDGAPNRCAYSGDDDGFPDFSFRGTV